MHQQHVDAVPWRRGRKVHQSRKRAIRLRRAIDVQPTSKAQASSGKISFMFAAIKAHDRRRSRHVLCACAKLATSEARA
jgi:hypothetical protein